MGIKEEWGSGSGLHHAGKYDRLSFSYEACRGVRSNDEYEVVIGLR